MIRDIKESKGYIEKDNINTSIYSSKIFQEMCNDVRTTYNFLWNEFQGLFYRNDYINNTKNENKKDLIEYTRLILLEAKEGFKRLLDTSIEETKKLLDYIFIDYINSYIKKEDLIYLEKALKSSISNIYNIINYDNEIELYLKNNGYYEKIKIDAEYIYHIKKFSESNLQLNDNYKINITESFEQELIQIVKWFNIEIKEV